MSTDVLVGTVRTFFMPFAHGRRRPDIMFRQITLSMNWPEKSRALAGFGTAIGAFFLEIVVGVVLFLLVASVLLPVRQLATLATPVSFVRFGILALEYAVLGLDILFFTVFATSATIRLIKVAGRNGPQPQPAAWHYTRSGN
jgi:hypothetical protein